LRIPGAWDGFELAVRAVLGQQTTLQVAASLAGNIVRTCGEPLRGSRASAEVGLTHLFPTPELLENANVAALGITRSRAATLSSLAAAVRCNPTILQPRLGAEGAANAALRRDREDTHRAASEHRLKAAVTRLRSMSGVGEWTAHYIAMRALGERDAFPVTDIGLQRAMADSAGQRATPAELLTRAEKWRPWRAYAAMHLWMSEA